MTAGLKFGFSLEIRAKRLRHALFFSQWRNRVCSCNGRIMSEKFVFDSRRYQWHSQLEGFARLNPLWLSCIICCYVPNTYAYSLYIVNKLSDVFKVLCLANKWSKPFEIRVTFCIWLIFQMSQYFLNVLCVWCDFRWVITKIKNDEIRLWICF